MILRSAILPLVAVATGALIFLVPAGPAKSDTSPFNTLLGSWGGTGEISLDKGRKERIKCNAYYTGGGSELGMAIRCQSDNYKIEIRSKLSYSGGRLSGNWEERTFNASGAASGTASPNKITLSIKGGVSANMLVSYTKTTPEREHLGFGRRLAGRAHYALREVDRRSLSRHFSRALPSQGTGSLWLGLSDHNAGGAYGERRGFADSQIRRRQA